MIDLIAFLNARLADDGRWTDPLEGFDWAAAFRDPLAARQRALREVVAKRAILAAHPLTDRIVSYGARDFPFGCEVCHDWDGATEGHGYCPTLRALAAVYGDHPDYRQEWA